jgi:hypothetical protein
MSEQWTIELTSSDLGVVRTILQFDFQDSTFSAQSLTNADQRVLGYPTSRLGRIFTDDFKNGALLHIVNGHHYTVKDSLILKGIFKSAIGNRYFNGVIVNNRLWAELTDKSGRNTATIVGFSKLPELPFEDYSSIYDSAVGVVKSKIYDPSILSSKEWKKFDNKMTKVSTRVRDDVEFVFAFFYYSGKLPFSHFYMFKLPPDSDTSEPVKPQVELKEQSSKTAYMKIQSFGGTAREMDSVMKLVIDKKYENLIVDLRNNSGGSVAAGLTFATRVVDTSFYGGVFLTQRWFKEHSNIPNPTEYHQLPMFSEANYDLIIEGIHAEQGLCLEVNPAEEVYSGNLFVLTNERTASTCEPIVYGLKQYNQAIIVGEKTAGAMLNGERFELNAGYSLFVPTATYFTSDGFKIDGVGVSPNIVVDSDEALEYVLNRLIQE